MNDLFKDKAKAWDERPISVQLSSAIGPAICKHVALHDTMRVMDFGAGTGLISAAVAPHVEHIFAVDISVSMLERLKAKEALQDRVTTVCQNIIETPLDTQFDLVMSAMAMHHVQETKLLLERFAQHLKPGGLIALADLDSEDGTFHPPHAEGIFHFGFDRAVFQELLEAAGFENIRFETAHVIVKEEKAYPIFLVLGKKR